MERFLQAVVAGIGAGSLFGLFSVGLSLIFGVMDILNFAHGSIVVLGMYAAVLGLTFLHVSPYVTAVLVLPAFFVLGAGLYKFLISRVMSQSATGVLVLTVGITIVIENALLLIFGPNQQQVPTLGYMLLPGGLIINRSLVISFFLTWIITGLLYLLLKRTEFGITLRATVDDRAMARVCGVNAEWVMMAAMGIGTALAGFAGVLMTSFYPVSPTSSVNLLVLAFVSLVLGGLGNPLVASLGGLITGVVQQLAATYTSIDLQNVAVFVVFLIVLVYRPNGLLGSRVER